MAVSNEEVMEKLKKIEKQLANDSFKATLVATDMLCWMQETGMGAQIPAKDNTKGMAEFLQGFIDFMYAKIQTRLKLDALNRGVSLPNSGLKLVKGTTKGDKDGKQ